MKDNLAADLLIFQSHLEGMLDSAQQNTLTLHRFQSFEMKLMHLNSLREILDSIAEDARILFDLDVISCCLIDEHGEIRQYLDEQGFHNKKNAELVLLEDNELLKTTFGFAVRPYLGAYKSSNCADFFRNCENKPQSVIIIPLKRRGKYLGSLNFGSFNPRRFIASMATDFVEHMASVVSLCIENSYNFEVLRRTTLFDTLTGLNNRRFLEQRIEEEIDRSQRNSEPLCCLFLDIDHFKSINDMYGRVTGDHVLTAVAGAIRKQLRNSDVLSRYGGEEFIALLSNVAEIDALDIAERIRRGICESVVEYGGYPFQLSISIGISIFFPDPGLMHYAEEIAFRLIDRAGNALNIAKLEGRNRVVSSGIVTDYSHTTGSFY